MSNLVGVKFISPKKGNGVFARKNIKKYTTVVIGHVILISKSDYNLIQDTILNNYIYEWDDPNNIEFRSAIPLSICQFFNHSYTPNLKHQYDYENSTIEYIAIRDIQKGEELTVNYNGIIDDKSPVWFEVEDD